MTEYTGWDNYVKEKTDWRTCDLPTDFLSDLPEGKSHFVPYYETWLELEKKVKDIQEFIKHINKSDSYAHQRIKDLEDKIKYPFNPEHMKEIILDLKDRADTLHDKVKKLENSYDKVILDRLTKLEAHNIRWTERVKALEESDKGHTKRMDGHHESIMELEEEITKTAQYAGGLYADLEPKVKDLEEWCHNPIGGVKVIDKKVWEDIKCKIQLLSTSITSEFPRANPSYHIIARYDELIDAIKKADPTWCPND